VKSERSRARFSRTVGPVNGPLIASFLLVLIYCQAKSHGQRRLRLLRRTSTSSRIIYARLYVLSRWRPNIKVAPKGSRAKAPTGYPAECANVLGSSQPIKTPIGFSRKPLLDALFGCVFGEPPRYTQGFDRLDLFIYFLAR
jgi:hypothetical protein